MPAMLDASSVEIGPPGLVPEREHAAAQAGQQTLILKKMKEMQRRRAAALKPKECARTPEWLTSDKIPAAMPAQTAREAKPTQKWRTAETHPAARPGAATTVLKTRASSRPTVYLREASPRRKRPPQFTGPCRRDTPREVKRDRMHATVPSQVAAMHRSEADFRSVWKKFDQEGKGCLGLGSFNQFLREIEIHVGIHEAKAFVEHVASLRRQGMSSQRLPRDHIGVMEFLGNRAKLFSTPQPSRLPDIRRRGRRMLVCQGAPPRKVANATFEGSAHDKAIMNEMLTELKSNIQCPGVTQAAWNNYVECQKKRGFVVQPGGIAGKLFPECLNLHDFTDPDAKSMSQATWNLDAITLKLLRASQQARRN